MSRFEKCPQTVKDLANAVLCEFDTHKPLLDAKVRIDFLFAFPEEDDQGNVTGDAIRHHGHKAIGLTRIIGLKDRTAGRGDAEVLLDGDWWEDPPVKAGLTGKEKEDAQDAARKALLDHELHHLDVRKDADGAFIIDDLKRAKLRMRQHDVEFGWFKVVAARHGTHSLERRQAASLMEHSGQLFWPDVVKMELATGA